MQRRLIAIGLLLAATPALADYGNALRSELDGMRRANGVPAIGLVLVEDGKVQLATAWGDTGNSAHPAASADTFFRVGSITKTFTALAMLQLVNDGKVSLDTRLDEIVGEDLVSNEWATSNPIRVAHLLELTAGMSDLSWNGLAHSDPTPATLAQALAFDKAALVTRWPPGTAHSYTNATAGLTSLAIERLSGQTFETFTQTRVLAAMGMNEANLLRTATIEGRLARGYKADGRTELPYWHMLFRGFGALNATPREMGRFLTHLLSQVRGNPRMLRAETTLAAQVGLTLGYGLGIYAAVREGWVFYTHGGDADGYRSRYALLPEQGRAYFVIITADQPATLERMRGVIEAHLVRDLDAPVPPPAIDPGTQALDRLAGTYYPTVTRFRADDWAAGGLERATVTRQGSQLYFQRGNRVQRLIAVAPALFRRPGDPEATIAFVESGGQLHLQGELGAWRREAPRAVAGSTNLWP